MPCCIFLIPLDQLPCFSVTSWYCHTAPFVNILWLFSLHPPQTSFLNHPPASSPFPHHVAGVRCPLLEYGKGQAGVEHARRGKHYHGAGVVHVGLVKWFDVLEVKHVTVNEGATDLLIGPCDEHAIVLVCLRVRKAEHYMSFVSNLSAWFRWKCASDCWLVVMRVLLWLVKTELQ